MDLAEHMGKRLLSDAGIATPDGAIVTSGGDAAVVAASLGPPVVIKAQVPSGRRGKSGAIRFADTPTSAHDATADLLGSTVNGFGVGEVLIERSESIDRELYAAVLNDPGTKRPVMLFSTEGGMDVEELNATSPEKVRRLPIDIRIGIASADAEALVVGSDLAEAQRVEVAEALCALYRCYERVDAELVEINPLALTTDNRVVALDAKITLDPGATPRRGDDVLRALNGAPVGNDTALEREARALGLQFIELDGDVGVLANGAGLTMATLDAVHYYGGKPANFLEIGGDAYTRATPALELVLRNPKVSSLLVNFCGAFARTDVMTAGVVAAIEELQPKVPVEFCIHGTGEHEATALVRDRLGKRPHEHMDDAVRAAVAAAGKDTG